MILNDMIVVSLQLRQNRKEVSLWLLLLLVNCALLILLSLNLWLYHSLSWFDLLHLHSLTTVPHVHFRWLLHCYIQPNVLRLYSLSWTFNDVAVFHCLVKIIRPFFIKHPMLVTPSIVTQVLFVLFPIWSRYFLVRVISIGIIISISGLVIIVLPHYFSLLFDSFRPLWV